MTGIVPGSKMKGVDICGVRYNCYIIRADLGCYLKTTDLKHASNLTLHDLHHSCIGDHYVGHINDSIYIIKDTSYRRVKNLSTDSGCEHKDIHPNYHNGDYYFSAMGKFYIVFKDDKIYKTTSKLTSPDCQEHPLNDDYSDGLYYWGRSFHFYIMGTNEQWGVEFIKGSNFSSGNKDCFASVHKDILHFLPGGLSITTGPAFGRWESVKTLTNDTDAPVQFEKKIMKKVGYKKETMTKITHNWNVKLAGSAKMTELAMLIAKAQLSLSTEYGGSYMKTENESWNEETEEEEHISLELQPYSNVYLWQYSLGLGEDTMFFCRDITFSNDPDPPTEIPVSR
ncbi:uncharacterized protein LOC130547979 [Triplophysa rosa]|uniref:uncharacterized protein LOC130547979 n=1 Tax=Triplophysa rosa TaxID=992332 RepID=UPI002545ED51|nr:uncharacterized protein LOC130547979 [Triplophysa rosa]XP_057180362.1 uncharacterized protein LOC130547979 [Triplophysa rosa]